MAEDQFVTRWHIAAPIEQVWDAITHSENWHLWWSAVESVVERRTRKKVPLAERGTPFCAISAAPRAAEMAQSDSR